jgi:hypothetical protein
MATERIISEADHWATGGRGDTLIIPRVGFQVVIALSNTKRGTGYLGYFTVEGETPLLDMLSAANRAAAVPGDVLVWYGGLAHMPAASKGSVIGNEHIDSMRRQVISVLEFFGFPLQGKRWLAEGQQLAVRLVCGSKTCDMKYCAP